MSNKQLTIAADIKLKGVGLHSGKNVNLTIKPAEADTGIRFQRIDIEGKPVVNALAENVVNTSRGTTISENGTEIMTIEHLCAAFYGSGIDNILVEIDGPEVPILDGSAEKYMEAIKKAGTRELAADKVYYSIKRKVIFTDEKTGAELIAYPDDKLSIDVHIDFNSKVLGHQYASLGSLDKFEEEIAGCKTFVFLHELEPLLKNNLIKGGDLDNALVIVERKMEQAELDHLSQIFNKPRVEVLPEGYLNNTDCTFRNEPARHKLLDVVGDLALTGVNLNARIIATKPGHHVNNQLAREIRKMIKKEKLKPSPPFYDPGVPPVYDVKKIQEILPHRPPFLLVDKITFIDEWTVCGIKNVTMNEAFFVGHYPEEPIMPGVLQIESMAQVGGILLLHNLPDPENYVLYFLKIENIKFKQKVVPGDTLNIRMRLLEPVKRGIALTYGQVFVGTDLVMEGNFMAQLAKQPSKEKQ